LNSPVIALYAAFLCVLLQNKLIQPIAFWLSFNLTIFHRLFLLNYNIIGALVVTLWTCYGTYGAL